MMQDKSLKADSSEQWDIVVSSGKNSGFFVWSEIWKYRDLLFLFVKRDFLTTYKQTILGPLWFVIQPLLTSLAYVIIFGRLAGISTGGFPALAFYMCAVTAWTYFYDCVLRTSNTFVANSAIFSKVYFPRIIVPVSVVISSLTKFGIQLLLVTGVVIYYASRGNNVHPNEYLFTLPLLVLLMAGLGLSFGLLVSSLTTRYRDLQFLVGFGLQLMMYASPVVYPLSIVKEGKLAMVIKANPMTSVIETIRYAFLGGEQHTDLWPMLLYSLVFMIVSLFISLWVFGRVQRTFMDTV